MVRRGASLLERFDTDAAEVRRAVAGVAEAPVAYGARARRRDEDPRLAWYRKARETIRAFAGVPGWRDHPLVLDLLDRTLALETAIEDDPSGEDAQWGVREIREQIDDILVTLHRALEHRAIDEPAGAVAFVLDHLGGLRQADVAELLGVDPRTLRGWKARRPTVVRKQPERVVLVARLVSELHRSMTPLGIRQWFTRPRPQLGGKTPLQVLAEDGVDPSDRLIGLARGAGGQLAT